MSERAVAVLEARLPEDRLRSRRIHELYLPSFAWLLEQLRGSPRKPLLAGLSAPQGSGKTTFTRAMVALLEAHDLRAVTLSIDDFYRTRAEQLEVAARHPGNRVLEHRGSPGTHDLDLGEATLEALASLGPGQTAAVPVYDKTPHGGRGDRSPETTWPRVTGPLDVVLLEGWCLAFRPRTDVAALPAELHAVNDALGGYGRWRRHLGAMMRWRAETLEQIVAWRVEAEERSRAAGRPGLDRAAAEDYIRRFLPVYEAYEDAAAPAEPWSARQLAFTLDAERLPVPA